jgi:hypothetical protein
MTPTDEQMCEAVIEGLRAVVRYFTHVDPVDWVAEANYDTGVMQFHWQWRPNGNPNGWRVDFANDALARGNWKEIPRPEWIR